MNRPTETGVGVEPVSKRLRERQAKQWAEVWGEEIRALEEARKQEKKP